jgi:hypothetical protein
MAMTINNSIRVKPLQRKHGLDFLVMRLIPKTDYITSERRGNDLQAILQTDLSRMESKLNAVDNTGLRRPFEKTAQWIARRWRFPDGKQSQW